MSLEPGTEVRVFGPGQPDGGWPGKVMENFGDRAALAWIEWDGTYAAFWKQTGRRNGDAIGAAFWFAPMDHPAVAGRPDNKPEEG